jgi:hypothetical protein
MNTNIAVIAPRHYIDELKSYYTPSDKSIIVTHIYEEDVFSGDLEKRCDELLLKNYQGFVGLIDSSALLAAYLNSKIGAPCTNPVQLAKIQDKYLSRLMQQASGYKHDISSSDNIEGDIYYPVFAKPRRGSMSYMADILHGPDDLEALVQESTKKTMLQKNYIWSELYKLIGVDKETASGLDSFVIEPLLPDGVQVTLDGYTYKDDVAFFGFTKSVFMANRISFKRFDYPYEFPKKLHKKLVHHAKKFIRISGLSNSLFNIEYKVDIDGKKFEIVEINTRPSSQFMYPIRQISGNHPLDIALGIVSGKDVFLKKSKQSSEMSIFILRRETDARVAKTPENAEMQWLYKIDTNARWKVFAREGELLSDHPNDSKTFRYAEIVLQHPKDMPMHNFENELKTMFDKYIVLADI